jgi:chorismate mutase/prephenate dehydratase
VTSRSRADELHQRLNELDRELVRLFEKRARVCQDLQRSRGEGARLAPFTDASRVAALAGEAGGPLSVEALRPVFSAIDAACRSFEIAPRVACVGPEGGFSFQAAQLHFGRSAELHRAETSEKALEDVARGRVDFAVVPLETLREGLAFATVQSIASFELKLVGEREVTHALSLVSKTGNRGDVERIYATGQHHALAEGFVARSFPKATVLHVRSATMALELVAENHGAAAIVPTGTSEHAAVLEDNVADEGELRVRYGVVSKMPMSRTGQDATAVLFSVNDKPGALHDVLQAFKEKACNLRRIRSRAVPGAGWEYVFYVEVTGHATDRPLVAALEGVKQRARMLKVLGSFPLDSADPPPSSSAE